MQKNQNQTQNTQLTLGQRLFILNCSKKRIFKITPNEIAIYQDFCDFIDSSQYTSLELSIFLNTALLDLNSLIKNNPDLIK